MIKIKLLIFKIFKIFQTLKILYSRRKIARFREVYSIQELGNVFEDKNEMYDYFYHYYWNISPGWLKEHRQYFSKDFRGFGEDAFHGMWYFIFKELKPKHILEIGIYRGQTLTLFSLLGKMNNYQVNVHGISPFTPSGDEVSTYLTDLNYMSDVQENFRHFNLPLPNLHEGFSTDQSMIKIIESIGWDLIYIDGNHDYEVAKHDYEICSRNLVKGGILVLDDSSLGTDYSPRFNSTAGHPGPSKVASEIDLNSFEEVLSVGHNRVFRKL